MELWISLSSSAPIIQENDIPALQESLTTAEQIADIIDDKKGQDIVLLDVSDLIQITEVFIIASGTSRPQVLTLADEINVRMKEVDRKPLRVEGGTDAAWVLMDYGDVVVHLFQAEPRSYYDLERLWVDAPRHTWKPVGLEID